MVRYYVPPFGEWIFSSGQYTMKEAIEIAPKGYRLPFEKELSWLPKAEAHIDDSCGGIPMEVGVYRTATASEFEADSTMCLSNDWCRSDVMTEDSLTNVIFIKDETGVH